MWFEVGVSNVSHQWRKCQLYSSSGTATELSCRTFKRDTVENSVFNRVLQASLRAFRLASWTVLWECLLKGNSGLLILIKFSIHCQKTETLLGILHYCHLTWWLSGTEDGLEAWGGYWPITDSLGAAVCHGGPCSLFSFAEGACSATPKEQ